MTLTLLLPDEKLFAACSAGDVLAVRTALVHGASVQASYPGTQDTPLHVAAACDHPAIVAELLRADADPNRRNVQGRTPLYEAAYLKTPAVWNALVEGGALTDIPAHNGMTPQMLRDTLDQGAQMVDYSRRQAGLEPERDLVR